MAASQELELAVRVLERNTSHCCQLGLLWGEWNGDDLWFSPVSSPVHAHSLQPRRNCTHVRSRAPRAMIKDSSPGLRPFSTVKADCESTALACLQHFRLHLQGSHGDRGIIAGATWTLAQKSLLSLTQTGEPARRYLSTHKLMQASQKGKRAAGRSRRAGGQVGLSGRFHALMLCCSSGIMRCDASD